VSTLRLPNSRLGAYDTFSPPVDERESRLSVCVQHPFILHYTVEQRKTRLTAKLNLRSNVDWLTEAIRRFSEAYALDQDFSTVNMTNVFRCEKVRWGLYFLPHSPLSRWDYVVLVEDYTNTLCRP
jgi:hypothetical protein